VIRYHGTPLTPADTMLRVLKGKHAMVSYYNPIQIEEACEVCQSVVLDCGTYSAWRAGEKYDPSGYAEWAAHWTRHPAVEWAVIPDVIDGSEEENDAYLASWPLPVYCSVPVYHMHESLDRLERLIQSYPRVALGSSGEYAEVNSPSWWTRMAEMMEVACDTDGVPRVKLHGLRMLDTGVFARVPLSSADSTNVARNIGLDVRWNGSYRPRRKETRAIVLIQNIEDHTCAVRWNGNGAGFQQNMELLG
jgi:hypothetical protein